MAKKQLQTPATTSEQDTPEQQRAAGMGGSYTLDPQTGAVDLAHRTEHAVVSRKAPLKDDEGNELPPDTSADTGASSDAPAA